MTQCHNRIGADSLNLSKKIEIEQGLDYLLSHFANPNQDIFPRTIATKLTEGRQVLVYSRQEALTWFALANWLDCRISAYRYWKPSLVSKFIGIKNPVPPSLIMIDLDICNSEFDDRVLETALRKALLKIKRLLSLKPTVIWSGNGYHIYIPINAVVLEDIQEFTHIEQVSTKFLRFAEWYLSSGLSDSAHNSTVSLNNCMLRIPGSLNSKNSTQVRIIKKWDGNRPNINLLIGTFCAYLRDRQTKELQLQGSNYMITPSNNRNGTIQWIEQLLRTPVQDHRKFAVWRILAPYLINVKQVSKDEVYNVIENWLKECDKLNRLSFYPKSKIREGIRGAAKGYYPISFEKLKVENSELYEILHIKS